MSFPRYPKYKESRVEWLGLVPGGWDVLRMRFAAKINPSKAEIGSLPSDTSVSFFPMEAINTLGPPVRDAERLYGDVESGYTYVRDGDVAFAKITPCFENGKRALFSGLVNSIGFGTTELTVLRSNGLSDATFLYWFCASPDFMLPAEGSMYGTGGQKRVSDAFVRDLVLALPSLEEQKLIADFLEIQTAMIDALIEEQRRLIELVKEKRQAVISHAITKGLDTSAPMQDTGLGWLDRVPASWELVPLGYLVKFHSGGTPDKSNASYWDGAFPWVSPKDMKVKVIADSQDHVTELAVTSGRLRRYEQGHVLIVVRGMILAHTLPVAINSVAVTINQDMKAIACAERISPTFLQAMIVGLNAPLVSLASESAHGTLKLESAILNNLLVALPPLLEQCLIVDSIRARETELEVLSNEAERVIRLLQERRAALISAAVTGKIDVRNYKPQPSAVPEETHEPA